MRRNRARFKPPGNPEYRRQGLPIIFIHINSTVKSLNQRIKGSENP